MARNPTLPSECRTYPCTAAAVAAAAAVVDGRRIPEREAHSEKCSSAKVSAAASAEACMRAAGNKRPWPGSDRPSTCRTGACGPAQESAWQTEQLPWRGRGWPAGTRCGWE